MYPFIMKHTERLLPFFFLVTERQRDDIFGRANQNISLVGVKGYKARLENIAIL